MVNPPLLVYIKAHRKHIPQSMTVIIFNSYRNPLVITVVNKDIIPRLLQWRMIQ